eukprot:3819236-Rhodomonas_salina.8
MKVTSQHTTTRAWSVASAGWRRWSWRRRSNTLRRSATVLVEWLSMSCVSIEHQAASQRKQHRRASSIRDDRHQDAGERKDAKSGAALVRSAWRLAASRRSEGGSGSSSLASRVLAR